MKKDKIFLPYEITRSNIILKSLEKVFKNADTRSLPQFSVQNHPNFALKKAFKDNSKNTKSNT